jgi:hypothetical protein
LANVPGAEAFHHRELEQEEVPRIGALSKAASQTLVGSISRADASRDPSASMRKQQVPRLRRRSSVSPATIPIVVKIAHTDSELIRSVVLRPPIQCEDTMLPSFRPTPTCTRFQTSIQMPCMKCGTQMRLALIEPRAPNMDLLTYRCVPCDSGESFLKPV